MGELFDTLVVFENYPVDRAGSGAEAGAAACHADRRGTMPPHYPLSLMAVPGEQLRLRLDYRPDLFERDGRRGARGPARSAAGGGGCCARPADRQPGHSQPERSATRSCGAGTTPRMRSRPRPCRSCSPPRLPAPPTRSRWCSGSRASPMRSSMRAPTSWRIICAGSGSAPRPSWGCASSARSRWWWGCSASSRPAAPICRSIPQYPARAPCLHARGCRRPRAGHPFGADRSAPRPRRPPARPRCRRTADRTRARHRARPRASTRTTPPTSSTPPVPQEHQKASWSAHRQYCVELRAQVADYDRAAQLTMSASAFGVAELRRFDFRDSGASAEWRHARSSIADGVSRSTADLQRVTANGAAHCAVADSCTVRSSGRCKTSQHLRVCGSFLPAAMLRRISHVRQVIQALHGCQSINRLWPDRRHDRSTAIACGDDGSISSELFRLVVRSGTRGFTSWTGVWSLYRLG